MAVTKLRQRGESFRRSGCVFVAVNPFYDCAIENSSGCFIASSSSAVMPTKASSGVRIFQVDLTERSTATLVGSTEPWDIIDVLVPDDVLAAERERRARLLHDATSEARQNFSAELVFAADQFVITPAGRFEEAARAHAAGDEVRTVIAGYHWLPIGDATR